MFVKRMISQQDLRYAFYLCAGLGDATAAGSGDQNMDLIREGPGGADGMQGRIL